MKTSTCARFRKQMSPTNLPVKVNSKNGNGSMSGKIYLLGGGDELLPLGESHYEAESVLQKLLADYPDLLAGEQVNPSDPRRWLLISREVAVAGEEGGGRDGPSIIYLSIRTGYQRWSRSRGAPTRRFVGRLSARCSTVRRTGGSRRVREAPARHAGSNARGPSRPLD
jgi:hypothetical protein